jgi:hypothetical protein
VGPSIICATNATKQFPLFSTERETNRKTGNPEKENRRGEGGIQKERKSKTPKRREKSRNAIAMLGRAMDVS